PHAIGGGRLSVPTGLSDGQAGRAHIPRLTEKSGQGYLFIPEAVIGREACTAVPASLQKGFDRRGGNHRWRQGHAFLRPVILIESRFRSSWEPLSHCMGPVANVLEPVGSIPRTASARD